MHFLRTLHILSQIMVICLRVKIAFPGLPGLTGMDVDAADDVDAMAMEAVLMAAASSIIGSGELGGVVLSAGICLRLLSLLSSSRRLLAISAGVRGVSLNAEVDREAAANGEEDVDVWERFCLRSKAAS
jgi:hypothetical protein